MDVAKQLKEIIIRDYKTGNLKLPAIPDVLFRVREMLMDESQSIENISQVVQIEHALSTRLLQIVNSPLYRSRKPITSCSEAIARLGLAATQNLATSLALKNSYLGNNVDTQRWMRKAWEESCRVAAISQALGSVTVGLSADRAMLAGMIHNIGILPLIHYLDRFPEFLADTPRVEKLLGGLQGKMGTLLLRYWKFDEELAVIPAHMDDWMYDSGNRRPQYLDIVLVARAHSMIQEHSSEFRPEMLTQMTAFLKLPFSKLGPAGSFELLERSREQVEYLYRLLYGEE